MTYIWPQNKNRSAWLIFHGPVNCCLISWRLSDGWKSYCRTMSQCDATFVLKINVGHTLRTFWLMNILLWDNESMHGQCFLPHYYILFLSPVISASCIFCSKQYFSFICKARFRRATLSSDSCMLCRRPHLVRSCQICRSIPFIRLGNRIGYLTLITTKSLTTLCRCNSYGGWLGRAMVLGSFQC